MTIYAHRNDRHRRQYPNDGSDGHNSSRRGVAYLLASQENRVAHEHDLELV